VTAPLLVATVFAVGVLHTLVPDHWAPIVALARAQRWTLVQTARAAALAGFGHVVSTLVLGGVLWAAGATLATRYGHAVNVAAALGLIGFGAWIAYEGWREARGASAPHDERQQGRTTALLLVVGSSPMLEGIPAFLAASTYGPGLLAVMALVFAAATIATYVATCVAGVAGLQRVSLGAFERYGEVLSGTIVAMVGVYALVTA